MLPHEWLHGIAGRPEFNRVVPPHLLQVYSQAEVPAHPALALVANCEQVLNARYSRRLITMQKARLPSKMP